MNPSPENNDFARLIAALEPWLEQVVIIGGWAHRLYRLDPRAQQLDYAPIMTLDADVAVPAGLEVKQPDILERLVSDGFQEEFSGDDEPPATRYRLGDVTTGFYAEFLAPLTGGEYDRGGKRKATVRIAGVVSQRLRYLELLLKAPWSVSLHESNGFPFQQAKQVRIANPTSFLAHKLLIHRRRTRAKFARDVLYMHDTLEAFGGRPEDLRNEWTNHLKPELHKRHVRIVERAAETIFDDVNDSVRQAALIASGRNLSPEAILEVCRLGLKRVFG